jgi:hypothetical protein
VASEAARQLVDACKDNPIFTHVALSPAERSAIGAGLARLPGSTGALARVLHDRWDELDTPERVSALLFLAELLTGVVSVEDELPLE